jgi:N-acetylmuramoyl-L-alanine amidase
MLRLRFGLALFFAVAAVALAANLSPLATEPNWKTLDQYKGTVTREDFVRLLQNVYATRGYDDLIRIGNDDAEIVTDREKNSTFTLRFARENAGKPPRYWRFIDTLPPARTDKPLAHLRIALDPGHIGGEWAKMEERWYQIGESTPVEEGDMTLLVAQLLAKRLRELGADVSFVRSKNAPVTPKRPDDLRVVARAVLKKNGVANPTEKYVANDEATKPNSIQWQSELLFYRQSEIRYRARKVNTDLRPDLVICLHFNAEPWGDPKSPTLTDINHFHMLLNGSYLPDEIALDDQRFEMLRKLLSRAFDEELPLADKMAETFAHHTGLPPYQYTTDTVAKVGASGYVYARNLLATRLYRCPVVYFEPYVMNSNEVFARVQAGDYEGTRDLNGVQRPSIFREYASAVADGLEEYCRSVRKLRD